ncbi:hypothetical protein [Acinetobacter seifertii]|uniref:hypothetical protein n=1 Tax=Acinetobacter seifertii TaxID=1530123 RepID=UPI003F71B5A9
MDLYDRCPRRFLYTHLLSIGGRREETAFMQMHEAVRDVFKALIGIEKNPAINLKSMLEATFEKYGLHEHGYVNDYRSIAEMMLKFFIESEMEQQLKF